MHIIAIVQIFYRLVLLNAARKPKAFNDFVFQNLQNEWCIIWRDPFGSLIRNIKSLSDRYNGVKGITKNFSIATGFVVI